MEFKDYYAILGVARNADSGDIKKAYRRLARKYHPDVSQEADAETRFKDVQEAYEVLRDPEKRRAYDRLGSDWRAGQEFRPPPNWHRQFEDISRHDFGGSGFSDFFDSLFGRAFRDTGVHGHSRAQARGRDQHATLKITLEDAYHGAARTINVADRGINGRSLNVKIPRGVTPGQRIRLAGQGTRGFSTSGDLYLEVEFAEHPLFRVENRDVYLDLPLAPWEAALGQTVTVPTLGGKVDLKIPPGAQSGQKLRLKGRGLPGSVPGDQYNVIQIVIPPADTPQARALYEKMAAELPINPRAKFA